MKKMNRHSAAALCAAIFIGIFWGGLSAIAADYVWPLDRVKQVTSGFCAHRAAHYHGGIDLSTGGKTGLKVHAADSGYIYRITTSYWGYGKAIYLKMADGRIAVYGHLAQFNQAIRKYAENQQYSLRRYNTNLFPLADELPVTRGEVIAYSGQSGSGPPHLHFEIRTATNFPLNPLALAVDYPDQTSLKFSGVLLRPLLSLDPTATVNGRRAPEFYPAERTGNGRYTIKKRIKAGGTVGLAVKVADPTGYKKYEKPPQRLTLAVGGSEFFGLTYDSLDYGLNSQIYLDYDFAWLAAAGDYVHRLYRLAGNSLPWYDPDLGGDGILDYSRPGTPLIAGENRLSITAFDAAGNQAVLELTVLLNRPPQLTDVRLTEDGGRWYLTGQVIKEGEDYLAHLDLSGLAQDGASRLVIWQRDDSVTSGEFRFLVDRPIIAGSSLQLVVTDSWNEKSVFPLTVPGELSSTPARMEKIPTHLFGEFAPGGVVISGDKSSTPEEDQRIVFEIQAVDSVSTPGFFIDALAVSKLSSEQAGSRFEMAPGRSGIVRALGLDEKLISSDVLLWPDNLIAVTPGSGREVFSTDQLARARFSPGDLYQADFFRIQPFVFPRQLEHKPASILYSFEPISVAFARKVEIGISYQELDDKLDDLALYALTPDRRGWKYLGREVESDKKIMTARVWSFGPYALLADTQPPKISRVRPGKGGKTSNRRPEITFKLEDNLSGIGSDQALEILLDGEWLIPEYNPETKLGRTRPRRKLELGTHKLEITAHDRVGREDYFLRYFTVVKK